MERFERVTVRHPRAGRAWFNLGFAQLRAGDPRAGLVSFGRALDLGYRTPTTLYNLACAAAQSGDREAAFRWLDRSERAGMQLQGYLALDRDLAPLRTDARFWALLARVDVKLAARWHEGRKKR